MQSIGKSGVPPGSDFVVDGDTLKNPFYGG